MRNRYLVLFFVLFVLATSVAAAQAPAAQTAEKKPTSSPGKPYGDLIRSGDYAGAKAAVDEEKQATKTPTEAASVSLDYANTIVRTYKQAPVKNPELQREAARELDNVIRTGDVKQQLVARNNLAVMETARGDRAAAIRVFEEGYETAKSATDPKVRGQYLFNYARAIEQGGTGQGGQAPPQAPLPDAQPAPSSRGAAALYKEAFLADPRLREAADAGFRISVTSRQLAQAASFASMLADKGHYSTAEEALKAALSNAEVRAQPETPWLLMSAMNLVTRQALSRKQFREEWGGFLTRLGGMTPQAVTTRNLMVMAYEEKPPAVLGHFPDSGQRKFEARRQLKLEWMPDEQVEHLSDYFTHVARVRAREALTVPDRAAEFLAAETLYTTAFYLRPENVDAAIGKATLLWDRREEIDADGLKLNYMIDELYAGKGEAYLGRDWSAIQRFHTVLGHIYYQRKLCGRRNDVRSALFQLHHAIDARRNLPADQHRPVPGLFSMLAQCYEIVKQPANAFAAYQDAAREALLAHNAPLALQMIDEKIPAISNYQPTAGQVQTLARLRAQASRPDPE